MIDALVDALDRSAWTTALPLALDVWRATRLDVAADLVEAVGARCPRDAGPPVAKDVHAWWLAHAHPYDPPAVTSLVARLAVRAGSANRREPGPWQAAALLAPLRAAGDGWGGSGHVNLLERLAAMTAWPADPRTTTAFVRALVDAPVRRFRVDALYVAIAEQLISLGDARAIPVLRTCADEPRGHTNELRQLQQSLAIRAIAGILGAARAPAPPEAEASLAACLARLSPPPPTERIGRAAALWDEIAASRDAPDACRVLGDALVEAGDTRGELIALACTWGDDDPRIRRLLDEHWETWLGDLALVLVRAGTELRRGMLHGVRVGKEATPRWAYAKVRGHRELRTVRVVRANHTVDATDFATFVAGLATPPHTLELCAPDMAAALRRVAGTLPVETLVYRHRHHWATDRQPVALVPVFEELAHVLPTLATLHLAVVDNQLPDVLDRLPGLFPRLRKIRLDRAVVTYAGYERLAEHALVELVG